MDKYSNFDELSAAQVEGRDYRIKVQPRDNRATAIIAPHGGSIEPGTSELVRAVAGDDLGFACFEGIKSSGNGDLHITSTNFDVPAIVALVESAQFVIALHGEHSASDTIYLGGADDDLAHCLQQRMSQAGFDVQRHQAESLQGKSPRNICNKGQRRRGVQLELANGLRRSLFASLTRVGLRTTTDMFDCLVASIRDGLRDGGAL
jgi:phage replication-related protein YjqB (UPF0714/DUF867 family)